MAEILKEWLTERLQKPVKWGAEDFGDMMKNGYIVAGVLFSYHVISEEKYFLIRDSNAQDDIDNNWKLLREWLRELDMSLMDTDLANIKEGRGSTLLRLFYQLFLNLDTRDRTNFIKRERKMVSNLVDKVTKRFKLEKVAEVKPSIVDNLSKPLLDEKVYIEWQRKKAEEVQDTYDYIRYRYKKMLNKIEESRSAVKYDTPEGQNMRKKEREEMDRFAERLPWKFKNFTYEELMQLEEQAAERRKSIVDTQWANEYMNNLYSRMNNKSDSEEFQKQIRNVLSGSLWDMTVAEEEAKHDTELAKKVLKLSQFEKQMCTQIMETKQQARNLVKNRVQAEKEFADQRDQQFNNFLDNMKEQINLEVVEIDFEKQRQNMLHKKLYDEKMKRKRQHYFEICYETMLSLVDYATRYAYFKMLIGDDIPDHYIQEWKTLFYRKQPIFDILNPMEKLLLEHQIEEELNPEEEEIIRLELDRQDALNDNDFKEYHNYSGPWSLDTLIPNYDPEVEERKYEYLGTRILGHVVYTLLDIKYPYPPARPPADLPDFPVKALLRCLPDRSITTAMQVLLKNREVHVTRLEAAINFCLKKFKIEMIGCTDIDLSYDKFIGVAQDEDSKDLIRLVKNEDDIMSKSSEPLPTAGPTPPNTKQTQTPKCLPEEEMKLSNAAELGKYAYEALSFGDSLTDFLISSMIVEYLRDQVVINGFVIINYPNSYRQAQILEEIFSGRPPPDEEEIEHGDDIYLEETISKQRKKEKDQYKHIRISRLVNDPHKKRIEKPFESYFTCYIKLQETEDILQELVIWDLTEDNSELLDRFYAILGLNYSVYYEVIEKELLALICKYIIGDFEFPLKSADSLFGMNVLSQLEFPYTDDKRIKSKIVKPEISLTAKSKDKLRRSSKSSKSIIANDLESIKPPESSFDLGDEDIAILNSSVEGEHETRSLSFILEEPKILAGEEDWDYGEIPIAEIIAIALATCWEQVEKTYIHNMEQLFFSIRLQLNCLIPYARFIKDKMEQIITLPCNKQDYVIAFQKEYNEFETDWRAINVVKNEWHCRVKELQSKLYHICDERKLNAEKQRQALICENWAMEELTCMVNSYISCMQAELNRSILTFQTMHDFYFAMLKRLPPTERLSSKDLTKITREAEEIPGSKKGSGEDKVFKQLKNAFIDLQMKNIMIDYTNNPFNLIIENNVKFALKVVKDTNDSYRSIVSREYAEVAKISPPPKRKDENVSQESISPEEIFKLNGLKCAEEWSMGVNGEMYRANLRLLALQYKCYRDMKLFNDHIYKTFMEIQEDINSYYLNEIKAVDRLCKYLQIAIEDGRKIPETLILEHDMFIIDPNLVQFAPPETESDKRDINECVQNVEFKISQLAKLRLSFKICAPTGIALKQAFVYLLQDFIFYGKESCDGPLVPTAWNRVDPEQIGKFVFNVFGETIYIDWRDFLIYCINIRFPTIEELLDMRKQFRCNDLDSTELIKRDDYLKIKFWYEDEFDHDDKYAQLRNCLTKHFLFELYETSPDLMNYSAFLLAFCKSLDPIEGFASALSMAVGKQICHRFEECEEVVCKLIRDKEYKEACLACAHKCTGQFLEAVLNNVINTCEGTSIIELGNVEPAPETDKKGKKGKASPKAKKTETSQSARAAKSQKSLLNKSKTTQSADNVKTTFICPPCEEVEPVEEKPPEKEEEEEDLQKTESALPDPNLIYCVSQEVIWNVLEICLPWHFQLVPEKKSTPYIEQITEAIRRLERDTENGDIYVSRFVCDKNVCKILHKVKKFTALNIIQEMYKVSR